MIGIRQILIIAVLVCGLFVGVGCAEYHISTPQQLQEINVGHLSDVCILDKDIDMSTWLESNTWTPIGYDSSHLFTGTFNGNGHTISNLEVSQSFACFIKYMSGATIQNIKFHNCDFTTSAQSIVAIEYGAMLFGFSQNTMTNIINCYVDNTCTFKRSGTSGDWARAATFSFSMDYININNCISEATVSGGYCRLSADSFIGGFSTITSTASPTTTIGTISNSYFNGIISGKYYVSGFIPTYSDSYKATISKSVCIGVLSSESGDGYQYRISAPVRNASNIYTNNYGSSRISHGGDAMINNFNGADVSPGSLQEQYNNQYFWKNTLGWDFINTWYWDYSVNLPKLRAFLKPPSFTTPTGVAAKQSGTPLSMFSDMSNPSGLTVRYQWQISEDNSNWVDEGEEYIATETSLIQIPHDSTQTINVAAKTFYWRVKWTSDYSSGYSYTQSFSSDIYNVPAQVTTMSIFTEETVPVQGVYPTGTLIYFDFDDAQYANQYTFYYRPAGTTGSGTLFGTSRSSAAASDSFSTVGTYQIGVTTWNYKSDFSSAYAYSEMKWFDSPLLEIYNPPVITTDIAASPNNPYVKTATNIQLSVTATDSGSGKQTTQYEWYEQPYGSSTWNLLDTTTVNTYTMTGKTYQNTNPYKYKVIVKGYGGSATSSEISVTPQNYPAPTISSVSMASPSGTVYADTYYTLSLQSTVSDPGSAVQTTAYQWYIQTPGSFTFTPISDGNVEDYTKANYVFQTPGTYKYHLTATGQGGSTTSSDLSLTVNQYAAPTISSVIKQAPAESEKDVGEQFQLLLVATVNDPGAGSITGTSIQWYRQYNSGAWEAISGATASTLNIQETYSAAGYYTYKIVVTGSGGTVDSSQLSTPLVITMEAISTTPAPVFTEVTVTPSASPLYPGQSFSVSASASDTNSYVWSARPTSGSTWTQFLAGASGTSSISAAGTYEIRCVATGDGGSTDSSTVSGLERFITVTAWPLPVIQSFTVTPSASPLVAGGYVTLSAQTLNTQSVVYDYRLNTTQSWTVIPGTTQTFTTAGTYYVRCTANNGHGDTTTQTVTVTVIPARVPILTVSITPTSGEIVSSTGTTFVINLEASENDPDNTITYRQWQILSPAAGASWQDTGVVNPRGSYRLDTTQAGTYYFRFVTSGVYDVTSSEKPFNVTISPWIRVMATATVTPVSTQPVNNLIDSIDVTPGEYFDPIEVFEQLLWPYTQGDDLLNSLILLCIFAVPIFMVWLITKNILVPSIIGLIFGVWLLTFLPAGYYGVSVALIALSIVGGIIRIFKPPQ